MTSDENPYAPPDTDASDPSLHAPMRVSFELTELDLQQGIKRYVLEYPALWLGGLACLFAPFSVGVYLEEFHGFTMPNNVGMLAIIMWLAFGYSCWYLMSLPVRIWAERNALSCAPLGLGFKSILLQTEEIEIHRAGEKFSFSFSSIILRGADKQMCIVLELRRHEILIIPSHAFHSKHHFYAFRKALKKRLGRHSKTFWTTR